jgi:hypothetical protein
MRKPSPSAPLPCQALKRFDVFDMLSDESKEACVRTMRQRSFHAGDVVVDEGTFGSVMWYGRSGIGQRKIGGPGIGGWDAESGVVSYEPALKC